jgi:hypothetical protein
VLTALDGLQGDAGVDASTPPADASSEDSAPVVDASDAGDGSDGDSSVAACDPTKAFGTPKRVAELESSGNDDPPRLLPDGLSGFFSSDRNTGQGMNDIYEVSRGDASAPFTIKSLTSLNSAGAEIQPSPTGDGLTLYYAILAGQNKDDIRVAHRIDGGYGNIGLLGSLNTNINEAYPYVLPDGTVLYFASDRSGSSWDLYYARINDGGPGVANLLTELNTGVEETAPVVSADDLKIFFARQVAGSQLDIFVATRLTPSDKFGDGRGRAQRSDQRDPRVSDRRRLHALPVQRSRGRLRRLRRVRGDAREVSSGHGETRRRGSSRSSSS